MGDGRDVGAAGQRVPGRAGFHRKDPEPCGSCGAVIYCSRMAMSELIDLDLHGYGIDPTDCPAGRMAHRGDEAGRGRLLSHEYGPAFMCMINEVQIGCRHHVDILKYTCVLADGRLHRLPSGRRNLMAVQETPFERHHLVCSRGPNDSYF